MSKKIKNLTLKKNDVVKVGNYKYIVYRFRKDNVELIPIDNMLESDDPVKFVPKMTIEKCLLTNHKKLDNWILFYLLNQTNPMIKEVLEKFLEKQGS